MRYKNIQAHEYISIACALVLVCTCALLAAALRPSPALAAAGDLVPAFGSGGIITSNPSSSSIEKANAVAIDASGIYIVGGDGSSPNFKWRIEKRDLTTGALIAGFGTGGVVISDPSTFTDEAYAIVVDASGIYIAGHDYVPGNWQWRIEKRDLTTGALIAGFGTGGVVTSNPTSGLDDVSAIAIDTSGIYVVGRQNSVTSINLWRVEKRDLTTGALIAGFGTGGVVTSDPSTSYDEPYAIAVDASSVYVAGTDSSPGYPDQRWRIEKRDLTTGALIAGFGTGGVVTSDPSTSSDQSRAIAVNASGIYVAGYDGLAQWRVEKRNITTGALIAGFGTGGVVTSNPTSAQGANAVTIDTSNIYIAGYDSVPSRWWEWRIEKRDLTTGALVASFGTGGVVTSDPSASFDEPYAIAIDTSGIYIVGKDESSPDSKWRIEKRESGGTPPSLPPTVNLSAFPTTINSGQSSTLSWTATNATSCAAVSPAGWTAKTTTNDSELVTNITATTTYTISCTGAGGTTQQSATVTATAPPCANGDLDTSFDTDGIVTSNPSTTTDQPVAITIDSSAIYVAGQDNAPGNWQWRIEKRDLITGALISGFGTGGVVTSNPSTAGDLAWNITIDTSAIYIAGYDAVPGNFQWRIEKRDLITGALISGFGTGGVVTSNPSSSNDDARSITADASAIYVVGADWSPGNAQWRIEKRNLATGALITTFDGDGIVINNPSILSDIPSDIAIDSTAIYVVGFDSNTVTSNYQWRIEKRRLDTGALITTFDGDGVVTSNPSVSTDSANAIAIDSTAMYVAGYDAVPGYYRWRIEKRRLDTGALITTFDSDGVVTSDPSSANAIPYDIVLDLTAMYIVGYDNTPANPQWRIEKRDLTTGALVTDFGIGGVITSNPSGGLDEARAISINTSAIYVAGSDRSPADLQWRIEKRSLNCGGGGTPAPTVTLTANPTTITSGQSSTLTWTSTDAASCAAVSPAGWTTKTTINDSQLVTNITATTTYIIACTGPGGTAQQSTTVTVSGGGGGGCGVQAYDGTATINLSCEDPPVSPLRVQKGAATYGIQLVHENDPNASKLRIQTPSGIKALRKQ